MWPTSESVAKRDEPRGGGNRRRSTGNVENALSVFHGPASPQLSLVKPVSPSSRTISTEQGPSHAMRDDTLPSMRCFKSRLPVAPSTRRSYCPRSASTRISLAGFTSSIRLFNQQAIVRRRFPASSISISPRAQTPSPDLRPRCFLSLLPRKWPSLPPVPAISRVFRQRTSGRMQPTSHRRAGQRLRDREKKPTSRPARSVSEGLPSSAGLCQRAPVRARVQPPGSQRAPRPSALLNPAPTAPITVRS